MAETTKQIEVATSTFRNLADPKQVMQFGKELKHYITENKLSTKIEGKDYAHVDGWKFAGLNFGLVAIPSEPIAMHQPGETMHVFRKVVTKNGSRGPYETLQTYLATQMDAAIELEKTRCKEYKVMPVYKYRCACDIVNVATGQKVGAGFAICSSLELIKSGFDEYAVFSMAQTRSIGKGFRNLIGYVMNSAGYETTPAEEITPEYVTQNKEAKSEWSDDIKNEIALLNTTDELLKYFNQLPDLHDDVRFIDALNKRKEQIKAKK